MIRRIAGGLTALLLLFSALPGIPALAYQQAPITSNFDYHRDRVAITDPPFSSTVQVGAFPIPLGPHTASGQPDDVMASDSKPSVWWDGNPGDPEEIFMYGYIYTNKADTMAQGLIYGLNASKIEEMVQQGKTRSGADPFFPDGYLWGGTPIQLPPVPAQEAAAANGISISPDGKWMAIGYGDYLYIWPMSAVPDGNGRVQWTRIKIKRDNKQPAQVDSSPAFFTDKNENLWAAAGSWDGGLATAVLTDSGWEQGPGYVASATDPQATKAHITTSPSWDPQKDLLYFGINNSAAGWPGSSGGDFAEGWAEGADPTSTDSTGHMVHLDIGYEAPGGGPGTGALVMHPIDDSVVVAQDGQSVFVIDRSGAVYWYPAIPNGPQPNGSGYDYIWAAWQDTNGPSPGVISHLALGPGPEPMLLYATPDQKAIRVGLAGSNHQIYSDRTVPSDATGWINPSFVSVPDYTGQNPQVWDVMVGTASAMPLGASGASSGGGGVLEQNINDLLRGTSPTINDFHPYFPSGTSAPAFSSVTPLPLGGMAVWVQGGAPSNTGLDLWVPTPYALGLGMGDTTWSGSPSPSADAPPGGTVTAHPGDQLWLGVVTPDPDAAASVAVDFPGANGAISSHPVATDGEPTSGIWTRFANAPGYGEYYSTSFRAPTNPGTYTVTVTATVPGATGGVPPVALSLQVVPPPPPPPPPSGGQGLIFDPGSDLYANPAKWTDPVTATLTGQEPPAPPDPAPGKCGAASQITKWWIEPGTVTITYPARSKDEQWGFNDPKEADSTTSEPMTVSSDGHGATAKFEEGWSEDGANIHDILTGQQIPQGRGYDVSATYTVGYDWEYLTTVGYSAMGYPICGWVNGPLGTASETADGTIYVNGSDKWKRGVGGGGTADGTEGAATGGN